MASRKRPTKQNKGGSGDKGSGRGKLQKVGALWLKTGNNGKFMSGTITLGEGENATIRLLVFKNGYKEESKHPDYVIYTPEDSEAGGDGKAKITDDDIPF